MTDDPRFPPKLARDVAVLAFDRVQLLDVAGPVQVFATANEKLGRAGYRVGVVSAGGGVVTASAGVGLATEGLSEGAVDTLLLPGGPGVRAAVAAPGVLDWVRARAASARRVASVCTGAWLAASAGLLDGRRAVTHWAFCAELARQFPRVRVEADPIFLRDGAVWSSAGVTAGIDLALALVEQDHGRGLALAVARHLVMFMKRPGGQAQFSAALALQGEERFAALHDWVAGNLAGDLSLPVLAERAGMSERSLLRHYRAAHGMTPARAVERLRVEAARRMLADTQAPVKAVARRCGFGSEETMRRSFLRLLGAGPGAYRARFGG